MRPRWHGVSPQADSAGPAGAGPGPSLPASGLRWPQRIPAVAAGTATPQRRLPGERTCSAPGDAGGDTGTCHLQGHLLGYLHGHLHGCLQSHFEGNVQSHLQGHLQGSPPCATSLGHIPGLSSWVTSLCHLSVICHRAMSPSHVLVSPPFLQRHEGSLRHGPVQCPRAISPAMSPLEPPVRHFVPLPCPPISCPSPVSLCPQGSVADPGPEATVSLTAFVVVALQGARGLLPPDSRDHVHLVSLHVPTGPCVPSPCPLPMSPLTVPTQPL